MHDEQLTFRADFDLQLGKVCRSQTLILPDLHRGLCFFASSHGKDYLKLCQLDSSI